MLLLREGGKLEPFRQPPYPPPVRPPLPDVRDPRAHRRRRARRLRRAGRGERPRRDRGARAAGRRGRRGLPALVDRQPGARAARRRAARSASGRTSRSRSRTQLNPIIREYRRASSTAIDASLKPLMQDVPADAGAATCAQRASRGHLFVATSFGGAWRPQEVVERPIYSVGSGPSMAPVAALTYAQAETSDRDLIVCDTGGTTFDVGLVSARRDQLHGARPGSDGRWIGHITGHPRRST